MRGKRQYMDIFKLKQNQTTAGRETGAGDFIIS